MCQIAKEIYANHFAPTAMEPVNVDASAKQKVEVALKAENYTRDLFNICQYQVGGTSWCNSPFLSDVFGFRIPC